MTAQNNRLLLLCEEGGEQKFPRVAALNRHQINLHVITYLLSFVFIFGGSINHLSNVSFEHHTWQSLHIMTHHRFFFFFQKV